MLSNSAPYPKVWVSVQILAESNLSAIPRGLTTNGNLPSLESASLFCMVNISRSWLIYWPPATGFSDALCKQDYFLSNNIESFWGQIWPITNITNNKISNSNQFFSVRATTNKIKINNLYQNRAVDMINAVNCTFLQHKFNWPILGSAYVSSQCIMCLWFVQ